MSNPFIYGQVVTGEAFTNRQKEKKQIANNIKNGIHTIIISPRRWGKSSLVEEVTNDLARKKLITTVKLDLSTVIDDRDFFNRYTKAILKATSTKAEEVLESIKNAFKSIKPSISIDSVDNSFSIGLNLSAGEIEKGFEDILNLPEMLAKKKGIRLCIALDEFQSIASFQDPEIFQGKLRSVMQYHKHVSYIFYGSRKHMMETIFNTKSAPFYNFGDLLWLKKISASDFVPFISEKFESTGKKISEKQIHNMLELMDYNPQYVQLLANKIWDNTDKKITDVNIDEAINLVVAQFENFYSDTFKDLSRHQKGFLFGLLDHDIESLYSESFVVKNALGSSANVDKVKKMLIKKDIIDIENGKPVFIDPGFRAWLKQAR